MKKIFLALTCLVLVSACGGKGMYLYENKDCPYGGPDRPWLIIGAKGAGSKKLEQKLCAKGELWEIIKEAHISEPEDKALFSAACGPKASAERFLEIYFSLPDERRQSLKKAFKRHGYSLNDYGC